MVAFLYSLPDLSVAILFSSVVALMFAAAPVPRAGLCGGVTEATSEVARTTQCGKERRHRGDAARPAGPPAHQL
jgi:hypothetical protein